MLSPQNIPFISVFAQDQSQVSPSKVKDTPSKRKLNDSPMKLNLSNKSDIMLQNASSFSNQEEPNLIIYNLIKEIDNMVESNNYYQ